MKGIIEKIALKLCVRHSWYDLYKMIKACENNAIMLFFIVGERRIGKTLFFQHLACELYKQTGYQTMWVRNKQVELIEDGFRAGFLTACKRLQWCPEEWETKIDGVWTNDGKDKNSPPEQVILFQSISTFSNRRGNETPRVMMIVFDEFMPEDRKYPKNAAKGLMSLTKTVLSGRTEARAFCLSNFISAANPYFVGFQVYPDRGKDITLFAEKGIAIEVCRGYKRAIEQDNPWNAVYKAGGYQDYATEEEDSLIQLIRKAPNGAEPLEYVILSDGAYYRGYVKKGLVFFKRHHKPNDKVSVYTPNLQEVGTDIYLMPDVIKTDLRNMTAYNCLRFENPNVMFAVLSTVFETV